MYENILYDKSDGIATVTLHRPDKLNAYTLEMGEEVVQAFRDAREDDAVRAVILTGSGRGFCAGVDLDHLKAQQSAKSSAGPKLGEEDFLRKLPLDWGSTRVVELGTGTGLVGLTAAVRSPRSPSHPHRTTPPSRPTTSR